MNKDESNLIQENYEYIKKIWDYDRNGEIPDKLGTSKEFYAKCERKGHKDWKISAYNLIIRKRSCPFCSNKKVLIGDNDLATTHPAIAAMVHPNSPYTAQEVSAGSNKKLLFQCQDYKDHIFEAEVYRLTGKDKRNCSVCAGKVVISGVNDFQSHYPDKSKMWDYEKNDTTPDKITYASSKNRWWIGENCGHSFEKSPKRMVKETGCSYCSSTNKKVFTGDNDLESNYPAIAAEWHPVKNGALKPSEVTSKSGKKHWWQCTLNPKHEWETTVHNRTGLKSGCPYCYSVSEAEEEINEYVKSLGFNPIRDRRILAGKEIDIYIPEANVAIEYNGTYWHSETAGKDKYYHYNKWQECKKQGLQLIQVWEDDYLRNSHLVKRMIAHKLGLSTSDRIPARKTKFVKLERNEAKEFMDTNHIQGFHGTSIYYGLKDNHDNRLVSVMSVKYSTKKKEIEISRFASSAIVQGGFSKLLKNILNDNKYKNAERIVSYSHNDHSDGGVYKSNGFVLKHEGTPGYFYLVNNKREHRLNYSPQQFKKRSDLKYEAGKTERELAQMNNLIRVWDSGSSLWVKEL